LIENPSQSYEALSATWRWAHVIERCLMLTLLTDF